jgi:hypothetical protein
MGKRIIDMLGFRRFSRRLAAGAAAFAVLFAPLAALAQDVPSYARPAAMSSDETITGRIRSVDGAFDLSVDDDRGFIDTVQLHAGTIINPTGLTLAPGMSVTILGFNAGAAFDANEIDTPYTYDGPLPTPAYYGPGYWCPGFAYGYGPSFSLAFIFGGGPWRYEHRPFHGRPWNGHGYFGPAIAGGANRGHFEERGSFAGRPRDGAPGERYEQRTSESPRAGFARGAVPAHGGGAYAHAGAGRSAGSEHGGGHAR